MSNKTKMKKTAAARKNAYPFHVAYERYIKARAGFILAERDKNARRFLAMEDARDKLMLTPLRNSHMRWALMEKMEMLEHSLASDAIDEIETYAHHLIWLGAIKADLASMDFSSGIAAA